MKAYGKTRKCRISELCLFQGERSVHSPQPLLWEQDTATGCYDGAGESQTSLFSLDLFNPAGVAQGLAK